ncbi:MAG: flagellar hook-basal body complex protein [Phycisphaerales bacterium]|nr:flagellar hook-basal body complex protein [Phycisphaerae bacterium]NNF44760.1 flagellar hook-basal body complex protein [Phycisphaerales bacterium]NNM27757.1 flagellar hook-basal body complex protein [Phycisphaerales bacterium]
MASTTALFTGLTGLFTNARRMDVIGNNLANVNTHAYKSNRMIQTPNFSRNFSLGTSPGDSWGGTNPTQVGLGAHIAGTQRNFNNGAISGTGVVTDVALEGDGMFIVEQGGERFFTRAGAFQRNERNDLISIDGANVMGYAVDAQFNIVEGNLVPLNIPVGTLTLAEASRNVVMSGNLNASGMVPTTGSVHETRAFFFDAGLTPGMELNTDLYDLTVPGNDLYIDDGAGGSFLALEGGSDAVITFSGVEKGGKDLGTKTFAFTDAATAATLGVDAFGSTIADYMAFLDRALGLDQTAIAPSGHDLGGNVTLDIATGQILITGNEGTVQDLVVETADLVVTYPLGAVGSPINQPFVMTKTATSDGESVRTSFVVYDSLGSPLTVDLSFVLQETVDGAGTLWEFVAESTDNDDVDRLVGLGVVELDANGQFVSATNQSFSLTRMNGAVSPLTVAMNFNSGTDAITGLTDTASTLASVFQDGSPIGTLSSFSIGEDGIINGAFTNGLTRQIGQLALAKFTNPEGLVDTGNNLFRVGPNSGPAIITKAFEFGTGRVLGGALELSNVDLSQEFINMILASTGYSASSRIITTTDEMIDQLLLLGR